MSCNPAPIPVSIPCGNIGVHQNVLTGKVFDLRLTEQGFVFGFGGTDRQVIILKAIKPEWLVNGAWVELDFRLNVISLCESPGQRLFL